MLISDMYSFVKMYLVKHRGSRMSAVGLSNIVVGEILNPEDVNIMIFG